MKLLKEDMPLGVNLTCATEVQIAIDISHEPWKTLAIKLVQSLGGELEDLGLELKEIPKLLDIIANRHGTLQ